MEKEERNNVLTNLKELVSIPTYGDIKKGHPIIQYLKDSFKDCPEIVEVEDESGNIHLLIGINCEIKDLDHAILLSGHIDTVPEKPGHTCNVSVEQDIMKGLGVSDMKAFTAAIMSKQADFRNMDYPIILSITSDEETHLKGVQSNIQELKNRNVNIDFAVVGEPTDLDYYASSRGNSIYVSIIDGIASHSSTPQLGVNAIELTSDFISEIQKMKRMYTEEAAMCITSIKGGKEPSNIVPEECSCCFGIRTSNSKALDMIMGYLNKKHKEISNGYKDSKLFCVVSIPPFERVENGFFTEYALQKGKKIVDARYATEAGYFQKAFQNADIIIYGPGNPDGIHEVRESLNINNLIEYQDELEEMIQAYIVRKKKDKEKNKVYK